MTIFGIRIAKVADLELEKAIAVAFHLRQERKKMQQEKYWDFLVDESLVREDVGRFNA